MLVNLGGKFSLCRLRRRRGAFPFQHPERYIYFQHHRFQTFRVWHRSFHFSPTVAQHKFTHNRKTICDRIYKLAVILLTLNLSLPVPLFACVCRTKMEKFVNNFWKLNIGVPKPKVFKHFDKSDVVGKLIEKKFYNFTYNISFSNVLLPCWKVLILDSHVQPFTQYFARHICCVTFIF